MEGGGGVRVNVEEDAHGGIMEGGEGVRVNVEEYRIRCTHLNAETNTHTQTHL